jgi:putative ATP-dependent endonuclease of OLD family
MLVHSIYLENYRSFAVLEETRLGSLATIIGQNDVGKSNILRALQLFFEKKRPKIDTNDVHDHAKPTDDVIVEVAFTSLPEDFELEEGVKTTFKEEMLVDVKGHLRIRKTFPRNNLTKFNVTLIVNDFQDDNFAGLTLFKENELNKICKSLKIEYSKSGRGITNKSKREAIRAKAIEAGIQIVGREISLNTNNDLWKSIELILPELLLFEADTKLGVGETTFQSQFKPIIKTAAEDPAVVDAKSQFTGLIGEALQHEVDKIFNKLKQHTDAFTGLKARPEFFWDKAVTFEILGKDGHGIENSLERRGSGLRRLLMVAFFQYLAERSANNPSDFIFGVEEPENCLHPGFQRELINSFRTLADEGYQIVVTSHSPVFAGSSTIEDLSLVVRSEGVARAIQKPDLDPSDVAEQLGVEPADQITGYDACVFVEGPDDIRFWKCIATKLKDDGHLENDFDDRNIGFVMCGGESLKHWINLRAMNRLNKNFGVVVDSDKKSPDHNIPQRKLNWKKSCEEDGGIFFISRKREIENYIHPEAIKRSGRELNPFDDFSDMKDLFGDRVAKVILDMSANEILSMDRYVENGVEHHELKEIVQEFLNLPYL